LAPSITDVAHIENSDSLDFHWQVLRADAIEAFTWLAERSPNAATQWLRRPSESHHQTEETPERHPIAQDESEQLGIALRQMLYGRRKGVYRLFFPSKAIP
jgi:hypothetical protein